MLTLLPLQASPWLPVWVTPVWVLAVGITLGLVATALVLAVFAILSRVPGVGTFADNPRRANILTGILTIALTATLVWLYKPEADSKYALLTTLPFLFVSACLSAGLVYGVWRRTIAELKSILTEGGFGYILGFISLLAVIFLALTPLTKDTRAILESIPQINFVGNGEASFVLTIPGNEASIDPDDAPFVQRFVEYDPASVAGIAVESNRTILLANAEKPEDFSMAPLRIDPDSPYTWNITSMVLPELPADSSQGVWIQNREIDEATVTFRITSEPRVREANSIAITAISVFLLVMAHLSFRQACPRIAAIAWATAKSEMAQPIYFVLLGIGLIVMVICFILPFNTLGEDIKLFKDSGITLIMVLGLIQAIWSAGTSVSEEVEGRTALTVLSKPVSRRSFVLGKYAGIMIGVLVMFVVLGLLLMVMTAYKPIFEARENSMQAPVWQQSHSEVVSLVPGLVLYFMETMAIAAIGVALATRFDMLANFVICFTVYAIGNLTSPLVQSSAGKNELVGFVGKLIAVVVPNLNAFNVQAAVDVGNTIPTIYLAGAFNYLVFFVILALSAAFLLFEDRDLA